MNTEIIDNILLLLRRVDLKGSEVEAFQACVMALQRERLKQEGAVVHDTEN
jgi:hypothetical protein